jgi:hypothetical protein
MNDRLQTLLDIEEIRNLRVLYSHHLDSNNIVALDEVFTADAIVEVTVGAMRGIDEIRETLAGAVKLFDRDNHGRYPFLHAVTNHWIKITGPDTAQGRCYLVDFETASKPDPNPLLLLGLYADEYKRIDGAWRISRSRLEVVWPERSPGVGGGQPGREMVLPT